MIGSVFKKDWLLLWPLAVLVTLIQVALEWAIYKFGFSRMISRATGDTPKKPNL